MAIVVAPYNPWRENLATQILGSVAQNYLQRQRQNEVSKKLGALLGMFPVEGQDQDAAAINRMVEEQRRRSEADALASMAAGRDRVSGELSGVPQTGAAQDIRYGLSGATHRAMPQIERWQTPEGTAAEQVMLDRVVGSYRPPSDAEARNWNMNSYNSGMANRIPMQFTPEGVFSRAAETPNYKFRDMINALADPRFSPYAKELMGEIANLEQMYTSRRNNNYLDMEAAAKANIAANQANMMARHAPDLATWSTALSSRFRGPGEVATSMAASNQKNLFDSVGNRMDAAARQYGSDMAARSALGVAGINAGAEDRRTRAMMEEQNLRRRELEAAREATSADIRNRQTMLDIEKDAGKIVSSFKDFPMSLEERSIINDAATNMAAVKRGAEDIPSDPFSLPPIPLNPRAAAKLFVEGDPGSWKKLKHMSRGPMGTIDRTKLIKNLDLVTIGNMYRIPSQSESRTWRDEFYNAIMGEN